MVVPEAVDERWCQAQKCSTIFSVLSCRSLRDLYFVLYDMNETRITMQKKIHSFCSVCSHLLKRLERQVFRNEGSIWFSSDSLLFFNTIHSQFYSVFRPLKK